MPIEIYWSNHEKTLIRWEFVGAWTGNDLHEIIQKSNEMINAQQHIVNHIIDMTQSTTVPPRVIAEMRYSVSQMPQNIGRVIIITNGGLLDLLAQTAQRF